MLALELERRTVVNIVADVFFIRQHLMDGAARPGPSKVCYESSEIQVCRDLRFAPSFDREFVVNPPDDSSLVLGTRDKDDAIRLKTFLFAASEQGFLVTRLVNQHAS